MRPRCDWEAKVAAHVGCYQREAGPVAPYIVCCVTGLLQHCHIPWTDEYYDYNAGEARVFVSRVSNSLLTAELAAWLRAAGFTTQASESDTTVQYAL